VFFVWDKRQNAFERRHAAKAANCVFIGSKGFDECHTITERQRFYLFEPTTTQGVRESQNLRVYPSSLNGCHR
jgi:hypothetical protein